MPDSLRMCMAANPSRVSCMDGDVGGLVGGKAGTHPNGIPCMIPMVFTVCKPSFGQDQERWQACHVLGMVRAFDPRSWRLARDPGFDPQRKHGLVFASENRSASSNQVERDYGRRIGTGWRRWASPRLVNMAHSWIAVDRWGGHSKGCRRPMEVSAA